VASLKSGPARVVGVGLGVLAELMEEEVVDAALEPPHMAVELRRLRETLDDRIRLGDLLD